MFFWKLCCFIDDPEDVGNLISGSSAFSQTSLNIWKFTAHVLLKPGLENFEHYFASVCDECNCAIVWAFFGIAFLWDWNENWPFSVLWKILNEMGIPDHLTCLWRNLYAGQEATVRTGHGTINWSQMGEVNAVFCHPAHLIYMQSTSWEMPGWKKHKLESRLQGEISITSDMQMIPPLRQKVKRN